MDLLGKKRGRKAMVLDYTTMTPEEIASIKGDLEKEGPKGAKEKVKGDKGG